METENLNQKINNDSRHQTAWEQAANAEGTTASERFLARLAKKACLSLWSYPNVYTDEGRSKGKGDGKELCDFLVVFGNNIILFSVKDCTYRANNDEKIAWSRWYKRAIKKSMEQLAGAENFIKNNPNRIFIDKQCQTPFPVVLPNPTNARYFLIAVTCGAHSAARDHFGGGSSGSVILDTSIKGEEHLDIPFCIGFPSSKRRFVHVLDEYTVHLLLDELDTTPDLVTYLQSKEEFLQQPGKIFSIAGEEELLAAYLMTPSTNNTGHAFPTIPEEMDYVVFGEGMWRNYEHSPQRISKKEANRVSYFWDNLIEYQSKFIRSEEIISPSWKTMDPEDHERIARALAEQSRLARRGLSKNLLFALQQNKPDHMFTRFQATGDPPSQVFVFLTIPVIKEANYETEYRNHRRNILTIYCCAIKEKIPTLKEAIGIASEPFSKGAASLDCIYVDLSGIPNDELQDWCQLADGYDILKQETMMNIPHFIEKEFPIPFSSVDVPAKPLNNPKRRRLEREKRKAEKECS